MHEPNSSGTASTNTHVQIRQALDWSRGKIRLGGEKRKGAVLNMTDAPMPGRTQCAVGVFAGDVAGFLPRSVAAEIGIIVPGIAND